MIPAPSTESRPSDSHSRSPSENHMPFILGAEIIPHTARPKESQAIMVAGNNDSVHNSNNEVVLKDTVPADHSAFQPTVTYRSGRPSPLHSPREEDDDHQKIAHAQTNQFTWMHWGLCAGLVLVFFVFVTLWVYHPEIGQALNNKWAKEHWSSDHGRLHSGRDVYHDGVTPFVNMTNVNANHIHDAPN